MSRPLVILSLVASLVAALAPNAHAHEARPAYLELACAALALGLRGYPPQS